jgi:hypothetical protein
MAGRILNRRELRRQSDAAESASLDQVEDEAEAVAEEENESEEGKAAGGSEGVGDEAPPAKAKAKPRAVRKPRKKAAPRLRARWGVFDAAMKQVAVFDYKDRPAADAKVAELLAARKTGTFFLQMVKEPMPEDAAQAPGGP